METETVKGDLTGGAIERYRKMLMAETARGWALVRMADCYQARRRAGSADFEQVVRDYADQKDAVAIARTLTALAQQSPSAPIQRGDSSSTGRPAVHMRPTPATAAASCDTTPTSAL